MGESKTANTGNSTRRALNALMHPVTLAAAAIMLLNDFVLRAVIPSWWTGKLSDAAWLVIVPPLLGIAIGWMLPRRTRMVGAVAAALAGAGFAAVKAMWPVYAVMDRFLDMTTSGSIGTRFDPTDLIALPALAIALWVWNRAGDARPMPYRWVTIPAVVLVLLADAPAPARGLYCLASTGNSTIIRAETDDIWNAELESRDGGLTWEGAISVPSPCISEAGQPVPELPDPARPGTVFRASPDDSPEGIEESSDGGNTWTVTLGEGHPPFLADTTSEAEWAFYTLGSNGWGLSSDLRPRAAIQDERSHNLIFLMGNNGVLVRTAGGEWIWADVLNYTSHPDLKPISRFAMGSLLVLDLLVLLLMALPLTLSAVALASSRANMWVSIGLVASVPVAWIIYLTHVPLTLLYLWALVAVIGGFVALILSGLRLHREHAWVDFRGLLWSIAPLVLFLLPVATWLLVDFLSSKAVAQGIGYGTSLASAIALIMRISRKARQDGHVSTASTDH